MVSMSLSLVSGAHGGKGVLQKMGPLYAWLGHQQFLNLNYEKVP